MDGPESFQERTRLLMDQVGHGDITAGCLVDQPYAQDQHETLDYAHTHGGGPFYLGGPLFSHSVELIAELAPKVITKEGSNVQEGMIHIADTMAGYVRDNAPVLSSRLRHSAEPWVKDNGHEIYRRPSSAPREAS